MTLGGRLYNGCPRLFLRVSKGLHCIVTLPNRTVPVWMENVNLMHIIRGMSLASMRKVFHKLIINILIQHRLSLST